MVSPWPSKPYTFHALRKTFGPLYVTCSNCRRFVHLPIGGLRDVDYRTRTFSCSVCGAAGYLAISDPRTERGMEDFKPDPRRTRSVTPRRWSD
jgi:hypothetical protein